MSYGLFASWQLLDYSLDRFIQLLVTLLFYYFKF